MDQSETLVPMTMCIRVCSCLYKGTYVCTCVRYVYMCMYVCKCVRGCVHMCVRVHGYAYMYVYM